MSKKEANSYASYAESKASKSPIWLDCVKAFLCGGLLCVFAQALTDLYSLWISADDARTCSILTLIFIAIVLTAFGVFDKIARHAGAGTLIPITGFANAVASPALDNKAEGYIPGLGAKIFVVAGPVILYGVLSSVIYGVIYWIITLF